MAFFFTECLKSYHSKQIHRCIKTCERCKSNKCASNKEIAQVVCHDCHRSFYGWECYNTHLRVTSQAKKSTVCSRYKKCLKCEKEYDLKTMFSQEHRCYTKKCMTCKSEVNYDHYATCKTCPVTNWIRMKLHNICFTILNVCRKQIPIYRI